MASIRQKTVLTGDLALFMLEEGKIFTSNEYRMLRKRCPITWVQIKRNFGNWSRCINFLKQAQPDLWEELQNMGNTSEPKVECKLESKEEEVKVDTSVLEDFDDE